VHDRAAAGSGARERPRVGDVSLRDVGGGRPGLPARGIADEPADFVSRLGQPRGDPSSEKARDAGDEDFQTRSSARYRARASRQCGSLRPRAPCSFEVPSTE
jgi:hypothetical protein